MYLDGNDALLLPFTVKNLFFGKHFSNDDAHGPSSVSATTRQPQTAWSSEREVFNQVVIGVAIRLTRSGPVMVTSVFPRVRGLGAGRQRGRGPVRSGRRGRGRGLGVG